MLTDKVAIITGAGHPMGIGRAIAARLAGEGALVVLTDIEAARDGLLEGCQTLQADGVRARHFVMDVTVPDQVSSVLKSVAKQLGRIDILVNNAGIGGGSSQLLEIQREDFQRTLDVNLMGTFNCCQKVIPYLLSNPADNNQRGSVVNIASLCGLGAIADIPIAYTASKFAVVGLTKAMALEYADKGIRFNAVCPGAVNTSMREQLFTRIAEEQGISPQQAQALEDETIALGRGAEPAEIAASVAYLAGPSASYVTGLAMPVAGGMAAGL
ncbi:MAG: SDR family oxidoreductase [Gammaproteobacteria bacterium]|jgi:NAD(P)-dependent dehydrogenase (short-subunit alcohol dehydrogenase family)|nr:SDR family oxidoreductase [Gammaproteobacteria bacterium]MBT5205366.1 SDR family oxidoreductase [Gammaproteobacteria bacterium]MBT6245497.1 SDR family oxidoreductase [Gammaproteobacteria bacterium]